MAKITPTYKTVSESLRAYSSIAIGANILEIKGKYLKLYDPVYMREYWIDRE